MRTIPILISVCLLLGGCVAMRQAVVDVTKENALNIETTRQVAEQCLGDWPVISGFIKGVLGGRINELPNETIQALKRLDEIAVQPEYTDYELGEFLGLKAQVIGSVVQIIIEKYAPNAIDFLPLIF